MANEHGPTTNPTEIFEKVFTPAPLNAEWAIKDNGLEAVIELEGSPEREARLNFARKRIADRAVAIALASDPATQAAMAEQQVQIITDEIAVTEGVEVPTVDGHEMEQVIKTVIESNKDIILENAGLAYEDKMREVTKQNARLEAELARRNEELQAYRSLVTRDEIITDAVIRDQETEIKTLKMKLTTAEHQVAEHRHENSPLARVKRIATEVGRRARQLSDIMLVEGEYAAAAEADLDQ